MNEFQVTLIAQIETEISNLNSFAAESLSSTLSIDETIKLIQAAIVNGQNAVNHISNGNATLEENIEQTTSRARDLNEFIELVVEFAKNQKQIAALTRVLALNTSLLSSKATKEQEPEQFANIANEFKAIANQINDLTSKTNDNLLALERRTDRIKTVTSGLNQDITNIHQLVQSITKEISKSRQAFKNIELVTDEGELANQEISTSNHNIIHTISEILTSIQTIPNITLDTDNQKQTNVNSKQLLAMTNLANDLLQMIDSLQPKETSFSNTAFSSSFSSSTIPDLETIHYPVTD
jgi:methyl-accepting chemotaxis protein PixJ